MQNLIIKNKSVGALKLNESVDTDGKKKYLFEGPFTICGVKNRNERIYDESEVLKHLSYLRDKIKKEGCILGELDHPEGRFEIYLKDVSHKITDLWYEPSKKTVMGRLELLDTPNGITMKKMVDAGCPLYVSSRAAGTVGADSHVAIQQIFTYDIVATPGFEQCKLDAISESLKSAVTEFINESKKSKKAVNSATKYGILDENVEVIETSSVPEINEQKNSNIDMSSLVKPLKEDIQVKVSPEKAQELGLNLGGGDESTPAEGEETQHSAEDILDITPTYAEQTPDAIEDIQPEFQSADQNSADAQGATQTTGTPVENENPFMSESCGNKQHKKKEESVEPKFDKKKELEEEEEVEDISEQDEKPNPVADGKLGSDTDKVEHTSDNKVEKNKKTMKNDDSETVSKLQNKKDSVKESTKNTIDYYNSILEEHRIKAQIKQSIINNYPFAISLSESNFDKFATLSEEDKRTCAEFIFQNQIFDIRQINEQFMRPLFAKINEQKNYIRLADKTDLDLYNNSPKAVRESIDKLAELYILESKADVDEFWRRSGIRDYAKKQVTNETFVQNFNERMTANEEDEIIPGVGYNTAFIKMVEGMM